MTPTTNGTRPSPVELEQGRIRYRVFGSGEPIVFVHGLLVDGRIWDGVAERLASDFSCIVPDWPLGSHRIAMDPDADLSPPGIAAMIAAFVDALGLERPTIVANDSGGAISQILAADHPDRLGRLVLTNCDTFEHFPPFPFSLMPPLARLPGGMTALALPFRLGPVRRASYGLFAKRPIDPALVDAWLEPALSDAGVKHDTAKFIAGAHKRHTLAAAERLRGFEPPVLFTWGTEDRFFKLAHAERLAAVVANARIVEIPDARTFVQLDQPARVAEAIAEFARAKPEPARSSTSA
jgi:pimeloyl-ACP methyl ester carboxylesterase